MKYALIALLLSGCGTFGMNSLSADQIAAASKAKDVNITCVHAEGVWGQATTTYVNVDQKTIDVGGVSVDPQCQVIFQNRRSK